MKSKHPFHVIDIRHQIDHISPQKIHMFEENRNDPANARFVITLNRHRQIETISDRNKLTEKILY